MGEDTEAEQKHEVKRKNSIELERIERHPRFRDSNLSDQPAKAPYSRPEVIYAPEKSSYTMSFLKFALFGFNFLIWLLGIAIVAVGVWVKVDPDFWNFQLNLDMKQFSTGATVAIVVGVVILVIGLIGLCGTLHENICLLATFLVTLIILVILEAAIMGLVWHAINNKDTEDKIASLIRKGIEDRDESYGSLYFIDLLQSKLECCGFQSSEEYEDKIPKSCMSASGALYKEGCVQKVLQYLKGKAAIVGGVSIAALILQIGAIVFTVCIICTIRSATKQIF